MKNRAFFFVAGMTVLLLAQIACGQQSVQQQKDSLRLVVTQAEGEEKLTSYYRLSLLYFPELSDESKMDTLLMLYDEMFEEAKLQRDTANMGIARGNVIIALLNQLEYDEVLDRAPEVLQFYEEHKLWKFYYIINQKVIKTWCFKGEYDKAMEGARKMFDLARREQDKGGMALSQYALGEIYDMQNRLEEMEQCFRECIWLIHDSNSYLNTLTEAYYYLEKSLLAQGRHDEVRALVLEYEEAIRRFDKETKMTQITAWVPLWEVYMMLNLNTGEYDEAERYLHKIESAIDVQISQYKLLQAKARILSSRKQYDEAIAAIDSVLVMVADNAGEANAAREHKAKILINMGNADGAIQLYDEYFAMIDSLHKIEVNAQLDEIRTQYEVDGHIAEKQRNRVYFLFALGGCILLAVILAVVFRYNRIITMKNRKLYLRIKEQDRMADELAELTRRNNAQVQQQPTIPSENDTIIESRPTERHRDLVARLREYLLRDKNFTRDDINRDDITDVLGTNRNTLSEAVKFVTGYTLMQYIRVLQLEESRRLFDNHHELTVEAIAFDCGFNSSATFYRLFRNHYGFSPSEYRNMAYSPINE